MVEDFVDDLRLENIGKIFDFEGSYNKYIIGVSKKNEEINEEEHFSIKRERLTGSKREQ